MVHIPIKLLVATGVALILTAAPTISPSRHDFGNVGVMGLREQIFRTSHSAGTPAGTTLTYKIEGQDRADFLGDSGPCPSVAGGGPVCTVSVEFRPRSTGPKSAKLVVTDSHGNSTWATLSGTGVLPLCTHTVVPCNYAVHYSGVVSWSGGDAGATADVVQGVATCNASGDTELTSGPGLVAVEFGESDDAPSPFYRITVACPTRYPPEPARPAELGHGEFSSYKQPLGMTLVELQKAGLPRLKGSDGEVSWNLCPNAQYVRAVRQGPAAASGSHDPCPP